MALIGEDGDAIETVTRCPTWFSSLISGATTYFLRGQGVAGLVDLAYPMANPLFGDLFVSQFKIGKVDATLVPRFCAPCGYRG